MSELERELQDLFDLRKRRTQEVRVLNLAVNEAQKDIRLLSLMFCDGVPDLELAINTEETLYWDSRAKKILYAFQNNVQVLEAVDKQIIIKVRPHLKGLVKKANEIFSLQ